MFRFCKTCKAECLLLSSDLNDTMLYKTDQWGPGLYVMVVFPHECFCLFFYLNFYFGFGTGIRMVGMLFRTVQFGGTDYRK